MSDSQFALLEQLVIKPLKDYGAEVFIFGSRLTGNHHSHSDVDILYRLTGLLPAGAISKINEAIEESKIPFKVDLVRD